MAIHTDNLSSIPDDLPENAADRIISAAAGNAEAVFEKPYVLSN